MLNEIRWFWTLRTILRNEFMGTEIQFRTNKLMFDVDVNIC